MYQLLKNEVFIKNRRISISEGFFWVDISCTILNCVVSLMMLNGAAVKANVPRSGWPFFRILVAIVSGLIWIRLLYFMQLSDNLAPLIQIIILIFYDIASFMIILAILIIAFANAFFLVG